MAGTEAGSIKTGFKRDHEFPLDGNHRLKDAVHRYSAASRKGLEERLFTLAFSGLVYPQIWEDPLIDLEALRLRDGERLIGIASGGCNLLSYLTAADVIVTGLDLNPAHVAFNRLKHAALRHLPDYATFERFFVRVNCRDNVAVYEEQLRPHLDEQTRAYFEGRDRLGRRRISYFAGNIYRHGLLGQFIAAGHAIARAHGRDPRRILEAQSREEQVQIYKEELEPLFSMPHLKWLMEKPASLFGLGIPPSQFEALKGNQARMADVLRFRLERLACGFDLKDNYFAWQAFGRSYKQDGAGPLPPYLEAKNWETLRARAQNVSIAHASFTERLAASEEQSFDAYVLLDAQDWMTNAQLTALWREIERTARPGARVIFRTAGEETILPGRIPTATMRRFAYDPVSCQDMMRRDRSSIYGGFHLYVFEG